MADRAGGRRLRRATLIAVPIVAAGMTAGIVIGGPALRSPHTAAGATIPVASARVMRVDLTNTAQVSGSLGYAGSYTLVNSELGTVYTALPAVGATIRRGQELYAVDGTPVFLFYGGTPEWRALSAGVAPGADVAQLNRNLIALGYGAGLADSEHFTDATAYAVELWQAGRGLPVTGTVPLGQVAYAPVALRITAVTPSLGATPQPGSQLLTATSTVPVVNAAVPVSQEYLVRPGDQVTVTMPDGVTTAPGVITSVSSVATAAQGGDSGAPSPGPSQGPGAGGSNSQATVQVTVRLTHPAVGGNLDQAPVTVNIVTAQAHGVLAVPISALVALAGGGYAVEVVHGSARYLVAVQTGLFSNTLVQVSGSGLAVGMNVEVPSS
jgi:hypothetical protein